MFNRKRIKKLEQQVAGLSEMLKVKWVLGYRYNTYSPPTLFWKQYEANYIDITKLLLEYFGLGLVTTPKQEARLELKKINK